MGGRVKIKKIVEKDNNCDGDPIILRFQHADVSSESNSTGDLSHVFASGVYKGVPSTPIRTTSRIPGQKSPKQMTAVALQGKRMTYVGTSNSEFQEGLSGMRTFIAIRHKNKMKLYEADKIQMSPYIEGHSHIQEADSVLQKTPKEKYAEGVTLVKAFGSKRKKLNLERREKCAVQNEDMVQGIRAAVASIKDPNQDLQQMKEDSWITFVPPCNREATEPAGVYSLHDLLTQQELDQMDDLAEQIVSMSNEDVQGWVKEKRFTNYFLEMCHRFKGKRDPKSIRCVKLSIYTELLITLLKLGYNSLRKKVVPFPPEFPDWLVVKVLDTFTKVNSNGQRSRSDGDKDKLTCYILVSVLLANDFLLDVQLLSTSLQIHMTKLLTLSKAVGITVVHNAVTKEYRGSLRVPLPKPIEKRGKKRAARS